MFHISLSQQRYHVHPKKHHTGRYLYLVIFLALASLIPVILIFLNTTRGSGGPGRSDMGMVDSRSIITPISDPTIATVVEDPSDPVHGQQNSENEKKEKRKMVIGIVDEHNDVMHYWIRAYKSGAIDGPVPLLHIDSHSDAALPLHGYPFYTMHPGQREKVDVEKVRNMTSIGDFIPVAQWMDIISGQVVWVQPNWPGQQFNFLPGNAHTGILVRRKQQKVEDEVESKKKKRSYLCMAEVHGNHHVDSLDGIVGHRGLCYKKDDQVTRRQIHVKWDVLHASKKEDVVNLIPRDTPYILDIDLDYFASMCSTLYYLIKPDVYGALFRALEDHVGDHVMCYGSDPLQERSGRKRLTVLLQTMFWKGLTFLPDTTELDGPVLLSRLGTGMKRKMESVFDDQVLDLWCGGREVAWKTLSHLSKLVHLFFQKMDFIRLQQLRTDNKFPNVECKTNELFGVCVSHGDPTRLNPSRTEIRKSMIEVRDMLQKVGPPRLVTIARSLDGYTPAHLFPFIEQQLIEVLRESFHDEVDIELDYLPGIQPAPPVEEDEQRAFEQSPFRQINNTQMHEIRSQLSGSKSGQFATADQWVTHDRWANVKIRNMLLLEEYMHQHSVDIDEFLSFHFRNFKEWKRRKYAMIKKMERNIMRSNENALRAVLSQSTVLDDKAEQR